MPKPLVRWILWSLLGTLAAALAGCYVAPDDRTKARARLVNATRDYASLDLRVDGSLRQGAVAYGGSASYVEVEPDKSSSSITTAGSATALLSFTPAVSANKDYAVLAFGKAGALRQVVLDENQAAPDSGKTGLRVVNAAADAGTLDVYASATDALTTAVAVRAGAAYGEVSPALDVAGGNWRLRVTGASNKTDLRLDVADIALPAGQVAVLVLTPSTGGTLVDALLVKQQDTIVQADGANARVRAMAGVGSAGAVTATLGGVSLLESAASPVAGNYRFVAAGSLALAVSVNGNSVGSPVTSLAAGRDATLLVYGPAATPTAVWVGDDNFQLPAAAGALRIRLVNGTSGVAGSASLAVDGEAIGSGGVAEGAAGTYSEITASSSATLTVSAGATTLYSANNQALVSGGVYTVFVVGAPGSTTGIIKRDR